MHTRPATRADLPSLLNISYQANLDDEVNALLWPHRAAYPSAYRNILLQRLRRRLVTPGSYPVVAFADAPAGPDDPPASTVLGYAVWERHAAGARFAGSGKPHSATQDEQRARAGAARDCAVNAGAFCAVERALLAIEGWYDAAVVGDPSACGHEERARLFADIDDGTWLEWLPAHWYLPVLAVLPEFQGRGAGRMLVQWALEKARVQGLPCALTSSVAGERLYERAGFRIVGWLKARLVRDMKGGAVMMWDPWGVWVEEVDGDAVYKGRRITGRVIAQPPLE